MTDDTEKHAFRNGLLGAGAALAGGIAAYAYGIETNALRLNPVAIPLPALPKALHHASILFLSDPHVTAWGIREQRVVDVLQDTPAPDLILWGGDFIQGGHGIPEARRLVRAVSERFPGVPTYGVTGNAEYKLGWTDREAFLRQLEADGLMLLRNRWKWINLRGEKIILAGVDDAYYGFADLSEALHDAPTDRHFTLLLSHSPQMAAQAARAGVHLIVSGHTHGGQVRLPGIGPLKTQNPLCFHLASGLYPPDRLEETLGYSPGGALTTFITRGIGIALVPLLGWPAPRFLCPPEISLLTLESTVS
ncbi:MAG: hypothetical protein OHK0029_17700 [Armatimonadaceae bacterium]